VSESNLNPTVITFINGAPELNLLPSGCGATFLASFATELGFSNIFTIKYFKYKNSPLSLSSLIMQLKS